MASFYLQTSARNIYSIEEKECFDDFDARFQDAIENAFVFDLADTISDIVSEMWTSGKYSFNTMQSVLLNSWVKVSDYITIAMCSQLVSDNQREYFEL